MTQIEKRPRRDVERLDDDDQDYYPGGHVSIPDEPAGYLTMRPPQTGPIQEKWSRWITPYRATLHGRLWWTEFWYRPAITFILIAIFYTFIKYG